MSPEQRRGEATVTEAARHLPDHIWRSLRPDPV